MALNLPDQHDLLISRLFRVLWQRPDRRPALCTPQAPHAPVSPVLPLRPVGRTARRTVSRDSRAIRRPHARSEFLRPYGGTAEPFIICGLALGLGSALENGVAVDELPSSATWPTFAVTRRMARSGSLGRARLSFSGGTTGIGAYWRATYDTDQEKHPDKHANNWQDESDCPLSIILVPVAAIGTWTRGHRRSNDVCAAV